MNKTLSKVSLINLSLKHWSYSLDKRRGLGWQGTHCLYNIYMSAVQNQYDALEKSLKALD